MSSIARPVQLKVLLSADEKESLQALADAGGLNVSDYLRQLIRRESDRNDTAKGKNRRLVR